jgi:phytoene/squalene synthetase
LNANENDAGFCREHALAGDPLFRISVILAPEAQRELTALYALFNLIHRTGSQSQEEGVARSRLDWWRQECLVRNPEDSSHPALRELSCNGNVPDRARLGRLIDHAEARLETPAMTDRDALRAFCEQQGRVMLELELGLAAAGDPDAAAVAGLAMRRGLWSLFKDCFLHGDPAGPWWLPLDLLARESLRRADVLSPNKRDQARRVFAHLLQHDLQNPYVKTDISYINQSNKHSFLMHHLIGVKHRRMQRGGPEDFAREMARLRFGEFLGAWSMARRFNRRK